jgi:hypothetical protein
VSISPTIEDFHFVNSIAEANISTLEGFPRLVDYCETRQPSEVWDKVRRIDIKSDITYLRLWLRMVLDDYPPPQEVKAFYFGIFNPLRAGPVSCDMRFSGSNQYDLANEDWACSDSYLPNNNHSNSRVLGEIYAAVAESDVASFGEYVLCLGYTCLVIKEIFADSPLPVAVGFDEGNLILVKS